MVWVEILFFLKPPFLLAQMVHIIFNIISSILYSSSVFEDTFIIIYMNHKKISKSKLTLISRNFWNLLSYDIYCKDTFISI